MITKADYCRKFREWGEVYEDGALSGDLNILVDFVEAMELPEQVEDPEDYCRAIETAMDAEGLTNSEISHIYDDLYISIVKSFCLYRLIYCGEELRTTPCPTHKGRWGVFRDCVCGDSGWLPNE